MVTSLRDQSRPNKGFVQLLGPQDLGPSLYSLPQLLLGSFAARVSGLPSPTTTTPPAPQPDTLSGRGLIGTHTLHLSDGKPLSYTCQLCIDRYFSVPICRILRSARLGSNRTHGIGIRELQDGWRLQLSPPVSATRSGINRRKGFILRLQKVPRGFEKLTRLAQVRSRRPSCKATGVAWLVASRTTAGVVFAKDLPVTRHILALPG